MNAESDLLCVLAINKKVFTKVPPSGERRGQRPERHDIRLKESRGFALHSVGLYIMYNVHRGGGLHGSQFGLMKLTLNKFWGMFPCALPIHYQKRPPP